MHIHFSERSAIGRTFSFFESHKPPPFQLRGTWSSTPLAVIPAVTLQRMKVTILLMRRAVILKRKLGGEGRKRVVKTIMTLKSQFLPTVTWLKCALHQIMQWIVGGIAISGESERRTHQSRLRECIAAVRCSQATTVGAGSPNSLDDAMDAETRPVAQPQCAAHHDSPEMEEERREDVDIPPRLSRRLVLLGAGSALGLLQQIQFLGS